MLELVLNAVSVVLREYTSLVVAFIFAYVWLRNRHLPIKSIAEMDADPEKSDTFAEAVAVLVGNGVAPRVAKKRIRVVFKKYPKAVGVQEIVRLAFETES